jgi:hypothetical protein
LVDIEFWRIRQRVASGTAAEAAGQRLAEALTDAHDTIQALERSRVLTLLGRQFLAAMRRSAAT